MTWAFYPLITAALYYLGARAEITRPIWSRYPKRPPTPEYPGGRPGRFDKFMLCAACSGTWYGLLVALAIGRPLDISFLGLPGRAWYTPPIVALCSLVWTPVVAWLFIEALARLAGGTLMDGPERLGPGPEAVPDAVHTETRNMHDDDIRGGN